MKPSAALWLWLLLFFAAVTSTTSKPTTDISNATASNVTTSSFNGGENDQELNTTILSQFKSEESTLTSNTSASVQVLHLMGLFPKRGLWHGGESMHVAATIAVNHVNSMNVIPGYHLHIVPYDTKCDEGWGVRGMFQQLHSPPTKILVLGGGCSAVSEATARASHLWNLVQVSYSSTSPALSEKTSFPLFARTAVPESKSNPARLSFFRHFGWSRIATLHQAYELFAKSTEDLIQLLKNNGMTITRQEVFPEDPTLQVRSLKAHDCRVIVTFTYEDKARKILCEAHKIGLYGPKIVWVLLGWYTPFWWQTKDPKIDCSRQQMDEAAEGYFDVSVIYLNPNPVRHMSGVLPSEFMEQYNKAVNYTRLEDDTLMPQGYDTVWAIALALNNTRQRLLEMGSSKRLEDFTYQDTEIANLTYSSLLNVSFISMRGPLSFDDNGDPIGIIKIDRLQGGVKDTVGYYNPTEVGDRQLNWSEDRAIVWKGGFAPRDSIGSRTEYTVLSVPLYAAMCVMASLGLLLACAFLIFNILLRKDRLVKMSSPRLNNVILTGCLFCYLSIFIKDAGAAHGTLGCEMKTVLLAVGISLTFGALFAKTWRVHIFSTNTKLQKRIVSDARLLGMVGLLVLVDVIVLVTWWIVNPRTVQVTAVTSSVEEDAIGDVLVKRYEQSCVSDYQLYFLGTLYGVHALVLLLGTFLAFETRNVHCREVNDSKFIGMCIFNVAILSIPAVVLGVALDPGFDLSYAIDSILVLLGATVTQCLIFVPKVTAYRKGNHQVQNHGRPDTVTTQDDNASHA